MKKRIISFLLAMSILTSIIPTVLADEVKSADSMPESEKITETVVVGSVMDVSPNVTVMPDESITETFAPEVVSETDAPYVTENTKIAGDKTIDQQVLNIDEVGTDIQLAATGTYYPEYGIYFDAANGCITEANKNISGYLSLPSSIDGVPVKIIAHSAFRDCSSLTRRYTYTSHPIITTVKMRVIKV